MPSWSHSLSEEHRWTGRRLIGQDDGSDDGFDEDSRFLFRDKRKRNEHALWDVSLDDAEQNQDDEHDGDADIQEQCYTIPSSSSSPLNRESPASVTGGGIQKKRTLLTLEEMEDSDEYNGEWEDDGDDYPSEDKAFNTPRSSEGILSSERTEVERQQEDEYTQEGLINPLPERQEAVETLESGNFASRPSQEESIPHISTIDSGRMMESATAVPPDPSSREILACKRRNPRYLKYPGKPGQSDASALSLARLLRVSELLHSALVKDVAVTKRDIYYKDVNLFGKQNVVDALIDDIAASVGLKRMDFNVVASPKGLVASSGLKLVLRNDEANLISSIVGDHSSLSKSPESSVENSTVPVQPTIIPTNGEMVEIQSHSPPRWALVIEKEVCRRSLESSDLKADMLYPNTILLTQATFTTLCKSGILADDDLPAALLSVSFKGKGYPDLATLHFLRLLSDTFPACTIAVLVDADPHGLDILSVYRYGSKKMRFTAEAEGLALGAKAEWLGVKATEWSHLELFGMYRLGIDMDKLIPISEKDVQFVSRTSPMLKPFLLEELLVV
ncbi:hypothetical protein QFC19_003066 [Naganishia cerealis]|uniref:Uncharacterized protein n=1 Tax=Naganishia cerealis TaxID=610337 RepID=A0ACC2W6E6_9TREE|nr:hypothetical protein QFC19_003066 [Naganishia cerealis]